MKKKIIVIGAGVGGAACAALLAKAGHEVTLLETHGFAGGRCAAISREGFKYDFGVHMFSRGNKAPHGEVNRRLGGDLKWITKDPSCRVMGKMSFDFPLNIKPLHRQIYLARKLGVSLKNLPGAFRLFRSLMKGKDIEKNDRITLHEYVSRYTADENIHLFINCVCQLYFALSYHEASAGEYIYSFSKMFNDASFGYPEGGGGEIPASFLRMFEKFGGKIVYGEPVVAISVEAGRVKGVRTPHHDYEADIVISNCGVKATIELAGPENFPETYRKTADGLTYSNPYVTIKYALSKRVVPYPVVFYMPDADSKTLFSYIDEQKPPKDPYIFMPVPSNLDPSLAPQGNQLVIAGTAAPAGADDALCHDILDRIDYRVCALFPDIRNEALWRVRSTVKDTERITRHPAGEAIGIGQTPEQVGEKKPGLKTPVNGLYLVGSDAGARGIGTEIASASALALVDLSL